LTTGYYWSPYYVLLVPNITLYVYAHKHHPNQI